MNITDNTRLRLPVMCAGHHCDNKNPAAEPHQCPYQSEIHDNQNPEFCTCCDVCRRECADDI